MDFLVIEDNIITNIVVAEPDIAEELGFLPWYDGARIGAAYTPPSEAQQRTSPWTCWPSTRRGCVCWS